MGLVLGQFRQIDFGQSSYWGVASLTCYLFGLKKNFQKLLAAPGDPVEKLVSDKQLVG